MLDDLFHRLGIALAIGLLVGLERGWRSRDEAEGERTAGLRTYALVGLLGGASGALSSMSSPVVLAAIFASFALAFTLFSWLEAASERNFSVTGVVAGLLTFALGALAVLGDARAAVGAAVAMTLVLALKAPLHSWLRRIKWPELRAALILLVMSFLLLPLLPDRPIDPWQVFNPAEIWLFAILIAGMSFAGYVAVRTLGQQRGIAVAAFAGGMTSSTATTLSMARLARRYPDASRLLAGGVLIAGMSMLTRVLLIAAALNMKIAAALALPLISATLVLMVASAMLMLRVDRRETPQATTLLEIKNPLELGLAIKLAAVIGAVMIAAKMLLAALGAPGLYLLAAVSGIVDVDALTLSMARLGDAQTNDAVSAILLAVGTNTAAKAAIATFTGGRQMGWIVGGVSALVILTLGGTYVLASATGA